MGGTTYWIDINTGGPFLLSRAPALSRQKFFLRDKLAKVDALLSAANAAASEDERGRLLQEAGREASAVSFAMKPAGRTVRGNRRSEGFYRKSEDWRPVTPRQFIEGGGMRHLEFIHGARGRDEAILSKRELWLPQLERWHAEAQGMLSGFLGEEIKRLRRCLGIKPSADIVREQTRERVRRLRARRESSSK